MGLFRDIIVSKKKKQAIVNYNREKYFDALYLFKKIAEEDSEAQYYLGLMYLNGYGTEINKKKALSLFDSAAEKGRAEAQLYLGYMYYYDNEIETSRDIGKYWISKAAAKGNDEAVKLLEKIESEKVPEIKLEELEKLAETGNLNMIMYLADTLFANKKNDNQLRKALFWYRQAANRNYVPAYKKLADIYMMGDGVKADRKQAAEYMAIANQLVNEDKASVVTMEFSDEKLEEIWNDIRNSGKNRIFVSNKYTQQKTAVFSCDGDIARIHKQLYIAFSRKQMAVEIVNYFAEITEVKYIHVFDENGTRVIQLKKIR